MPATPQFLYDGDELIAEYDAAGTLLRRYVHGAGVDDPLVWYEGASIAATVRRQLFADERGSIVAHTAGSGVMGAIYSYDDWGIPNSETLGASGSRFRYTGQIWLAELGMYYYKARIYSATMGRFLQTDPIGYEDGPHLYAYVGNDPINARDPTGMYECARGADAACNRVDTSLRELRRIIRGSQISDFGLRSALRNSLRAAGTRGDGNGAVVQIGRLARGVSASVSGSTVTYDDGMVARDSNSQFVVSNARFTGTTAHEFGHVWDNRNPVAGISIYQAAYNTERRYKALGNYITTLFGGALYGTDAIMTPEEAGDSHGWRMGCGLWSSHERARGNFPPHPCPVQRW